MKPSIHKPTAQILAIARTFPCLEERLVMHNPDRFDPEAFHEMMGNWSHGEQLCGLFILNLWNPTYAPGKGHRFDLFSFMLTLDAPHRDALIAWMQNPVWP